jgi:alkanesulfonate monooxygenase SsuD/methylene tetrahydromethanopterin reductase-like flavin-dependent oxidoreductase (luciferase family)
MKLGLGIAAGPNPEQFGRLAAEAEALGYTTICSNDSPAGEGLAMLEGWADNSHRIDLGVGVLPFDRHRPGDVAARVKELGLPTERLVLGIGSGYSEHPLAAVREGLGALREVLPGVRIIVAAMGPKMCFLAGELADGALLNWMTPDRAAWARERVEEGATSAGRQPNGITIYGYVRVALADGAAERLADEAGFYNTMPHYARNFEASGVSPSTIGIAARDGAELQRRLAQYTALDVAVVRVLSERSADAMLTVARAAVAAGGPG